MQNSQFPIYLSDDGKDVIWRDENKMDRSPNGTLIDDKVGYLQKHHSPTELQKFLDRRDRFHAKFSAEIDKAHR